MIESVKFMANNLANIKGIGVIVHELLIIAHENVADCDTLEQIAILTKQHSEDLRLGKVFGFSVSEYAFATLKWLSSSDSLFLYDKLTKQLSASRKARINELVSSNVYMKLESMATVIA